MIGQPNLEENIINFASDNTSGVDPEIFSVLEQAAKSSSMPYGDDVFTSKLQMRANEIFEKQVTIFPVATGSAANALALSVVCPPYGSVYCHRESHLEEDECAAPEFYIGGGKLSLLSGEKAKFSAESLKAKLEVKSPAPPVHHSPAAAVSITQATELGSVYSIDDIAAISDVARYHKLSLHMDGARIANAIVSLGVTPAEATWKSGIDVLSLGATKNGVFAAEAVIFFDPEKAADFEFRRKRGGHLFSKYRFLSSQLLPYLEENKWLKLAENANLRAQQLGKGLQKLSQFSILHEVETNMVFVKMPASLLEDFERKNCLFYTWGQDEGYIFARFVTSFNTTEKEVDRFLGIASQLVN